MIRYLKYIFLIFGSLALLIMGFFVLQNKHDLKLAWNYWDVLDYEHISQNCPSAKGDYFYPCFKQKYKEFLEKAGLTGTSVGLKLAFNFMDKDKAYSDLPGGEKVKDIMYSLNYLELNNLAIANSYRRFYGFEKMYGGYLTSLREFLDGAEKFSDNVIKGLEGDAGIAGVEDRQMREKLAQRFSSLKNEYKAVLKEARDFTEGEIKRFLKKASEEN